jgi:hypothetical protein
MTKDEALKMALEVMRNQGDVSVDEWIATEKAIKEALAQPEQEPVAWVCYGALGKQDIDFEQSDINKLEIGTLLYTTPPQRTWVGLTDEELSQIEGTHIGRSFARAIEAKLKEKNNG